MYLKLKEHEMGEKNPRPLLTNILNMEGNCPGSKIHWKRAILCSLTNVCPGKYKADFFGK